MPVRFPTRAAAAVLLSFAFGAVPALAQTTSDQTPATPPATQAPAPGKNQHMTRLEQHIAEMRRRLHVTPAEEPKWDAFAQVMRDNADRMDEAFKARAAQGANMNAIDDLRTYAAIAREHADGVQRLIPAFETFYDSLSPEQQKTADQVFRSFERRGQRRNAG